jgi:2-polyprenyl-6-methoxyphenol hydroxylase-like FAD-dependent oxidoreductase
MNTAVNNSNNLEKAANIGIVGGGPAALVLAIGLARRGIRTTLFERDLHPEAAPRFNPERSYTIDISGHGLRAIRHIDVATYFDERLFPFKGIKMMDQGIADWNEPGWTGSRGDIVRSLMAPITEKYLDWVTCHFECRVTSVDVQSGALTYTTKLGDSITRQFDFIIGGDGAGSVVRNGILEQVPGITAETKSLPNYVTMIELDRVGDQLDPYYLNGLSIHPFCIAGAIKGDTAADPPRWFCCVGTKDKMVFASMDEARRFLEQRCPRILELTSAEQVAAYAQRTCFHIGQKLTCSQLHGGKAVLLGDAAGPFPPVGQGVNAAMESAMMLDLCIGEMGQAPDQLLEAARLYNNRWKPEVEAVSWISEKNLFENPFHELRMQITGRLGVHVLEQAKSADIPYSVVKERAEKMWPLWV